MFFDPEDLIPICQQATGRTYPPGYGFALGFLNQHPSSEDLKLMLQTALDVTPKEAAKGNSDASDFISAYTQSNAQSPSQGWPGWLIEAAQLVLAAALAGSPSARFTLRQWGHIGYA